MAELNTYFYVDGFEIQHLPNERIIKISSTNKLHLRRKDPYGFWTMSLEKGSLPSKFSGQYTSWEEALKDIRRYLRERNLAIKDLAKDQ